MNMATFKPIDPKRDEFRRYLERSGLIEALTKVFVRLVKSPERPEDPIAFLRNSLGDSVQEADNVAYLRAEVEETHEKIHRLRKIIMRIDPQALEDISPTAPTVNGVAVAKEHQAPSNETTQSEQSNGLCASEPAAAAALNVPVAGAGHPIGDANQTPQETTVQSNDTTTATAAAVSSTAYSPSEHSTNAPHSQSGDTKNPSYDAES